MARLTDGIQLLLGLISLARYWLLVLLATGCFSPCLWAEVPVSAPLPSKNNVVDAPAHGSQSGALVDAAFRISIPLVAEHKEAERGVSTDPGQPVATLTLERVRQLRREGAFGLALALVEQAGNDAGPDWLEWEQERWSILKAAGQQTRLAARLQASLPSLQGELKAGVTLDFARLLLTLEKPRQARAVVRQMWIRQRASPELVRTARRLVIQTYLQEGLLDDAHAACERFEAEYYPDDPAWNRLRAGLLLRVGKPGEALGFLVGLQDIESRQLRSLARLRDGSRTPQQVLSRLQEMRPNSQKNDPTDWFRLAVVAEAAEHAGDWLENARALEQLLTEDAEAGPLPTQVSVERLFRAYQVLGTKARRTLDLSDTALVTWSQMLDEHRVDSITRRAIYLSWFLSAGLKSPGDDLNQLLVNSLLEDSLGPLVFMFYGTEGLLGPVGRLGDNLLYKLSRYALQRQDYRLAASLYRSMRTPPEGMSEGEWVLRRSRVEIFAGHAEPGLEVLLAWLARVELIAEDSLDRVMQVLFDLQTIGRHDLAISGFSQAAALARTPRQQRELLYWMAESRAAQGKHSLAADLFLRSAAIGGSGSGQWGQSARFRAAGELASGGLIDDARTIYRALLEVTNDPKQRLALGQKIQDLDLQAAWRN